MSGKGAIGKVSKRRKIESPAVTDSSDSSESESEPSAGEEQVELDEELVNIKSEPIDYDVSEPGPSKLTGMETLKEEEITVVMSALPEADPLFSNGDFDESVVPVKVELDEMKECKEEFSPGYSDMLPYIDGLTISDYTADSVFDRAKIREAWRQPRELRDELIGWVQIRREDSMFIVKCTVKDTTENNCTISYNETNTTIEASHCDCTEQNCTHILTAILWIHDNYDLNHSVPYWMPPVAGSKVMTIKEMFGFPETKVQTNHIVLEKFIQICKQKNIRTPALMKYYQTQDDTIKASLHQLMCDFQNNDDNDKDVSKFVTFCHLNINKKDCSEAERNSKDSLELRRELMYGRITEDLAYKICQGNEVDEIVDQILFPEAKKFTLERKVVKSLEKSMKVKIKKCGLMVSRSPIFATSPYGTTSTHVVDVKYLEGNESKDDYMNKLTPKSQVSIQLQMLLAKKEDAFFCVVHKSDWIDVKIVKFNRAFCNDITLKCTEFWKTHVYKHLK